MFGRAQKALNLAFNLINYFIRKALRWLRRFRPKRVEEDIFVVYYNDECGLHVCVNPNRTVEVYADTVEFNPRYMIEMIEMGQCAEASLN